MQEGRLNRAKLVDIEIPNTCAKPNEYMNLEITLHKQNRH